jgi:hypothetical protein
MQTFVRGGSIEAILDANRKVDRCLHAGAMAIGAEVESQTILGDLPQRNEKRLGRILGDNVEAIVGPDTSQSTGHRTGSTDMGDLAHLIPVIHPYVVAAEDHAHAADLRIDEPQHGYVTPAKLLAMTAIDLLNADAARAREILDKFEPAMTKDAYLALQRALFKKSVTPPQQRDPRLSMSYRRGARAPACAGNHRSQRV